jgi:hypothetical protein
MRFIGVDKRRVSVETISKWHTSGKTTILEAEIVTTVQGFPKKINNNYVAIDRMDNGYKFNLEHAPMSGCDMGRNWPAEAILEIGNSVCKVKYRGQ